MRWRQPGKTSERVSLTHWRPRDVRCGVKRDRTCRSTKRRKHKTNFHEMHRTWQDRTCFGGFVSAVCSFCATMYSVCPYRLAHIRESSTSAGIPIQAQPNHMADQHIDERDAIQNHIVIHVLAGRTENQNIQFSAVPYTQQQLLQPNTCVRTQSGDSARSLYAHICVTRCPCVLVHQLLCCVLCIVCNIDIGPMKTIFRTWKRIKGRDKPAGC